VTQSSTHSHSDEELVRLARAGSADAFEQLARRHQVSLFRFLQRRCPRGHEAEDLLQQSLLKAYQSLDKFRDGYRFKPWLFTLSYRLAISAGRRVSIHTSGGGLESIPSAHADPSQQAERAERRLRLWNIVRETLGEESFTAVWLFYVENMQPKEIATVMDRSWVWVKTALFRARQKLRVPLETELEPMRALSPAGGET
jgi:RNA polymerase sigma factor (sigma-70 family)